MSQYHKNFIMDLKEKYKHISGMRPQFATFDSEEERMKSEITSKVIERRIYKPAKRLISAEKGIKDLAKWQESNENYLKTFKDPNHRRKVLEESKQRWFEAQLKRKRKEREGKDSQEDSDNGSAFSFKDSMMSRSLTKSMVKGQRLSGVL